MTGNPPASPGWTLREISSDDAHGLDAVTDLHMELLDYGPMAGLGWQFVRDICYATHVREDLLRVALAEVDGEPAGFVAYTPYSIGFHRGGLRKHWLRAGFSVLASLVRQPSRIIKLARALKILWSRRGETVLGADPLGEVVCVAVRKPYLAPAFVRKSGLRLSESLIRHAESQLGRCGVRRMRMIVDADNKPVLMLYHLMGAHFAPYHQAGEPRVHVWFDINQSASEQRAIPGSWRGTQTHATNADTWRAYWERIEDRQENFRVEARDYAGRLRRLVKLAPTMRVLDFGCGFGHTAIQLARHVETVAIWDASSSVRQRALERIESFSNIVLADLGNNAKKGPFEPQYDLIVVHSVLQYMSEEEIRLWLQRWRELLLPQGRLVLSDLMLPDAGGSGELFEYLAFALRNGFFWNAFIEGVRESASYSRARQQKPLTVLSREQLSKWATEAGYAVDWLPENLSHRTARATGVLTRVDQAHA